MLKTVSTSSSGGGGSLAINTTPITGGTSGNILYDNAGTVGEKSVTGTGSVVLSDSPVITTLLSTNALTANGSLQLVGNDVADQNIATGQFSTALNIGGLTGGGAINIGQSPDGAAINIATTSATSNSVTIGSLTGTGTLTFGQSSVTQTVRIGTGSGSNVSIGGGGNGTATINNLGGAINIGGTSATGTITLGRSTGAQTVNIATGVTAASTTKAVNIGTAGNATSTTNIAIGSTAGTSTTTVNGLLKQQTYLVANLPTGSAGARSFVTDALTPTFGAAVAGSGAVGVPVYHDGTSWKVG